MATDINRLLSSPILTPGLQALSPSLAPVDSDADSNLTVAALVQAQLPWIRRRLRSLFPPHLDLDELEQKVLLNVLRSLPSYRAEGSLRAWVDSITLRVGLSHARRVRARERREQALAEGLGDFQQPLPSEAYFTRRQVQGLLSVLLLPTPRGLVIAQPRHRTS